ncbi:MFS transporter [Catenulispora pinisilvae]|uniref:MFS transporter n=1 Tax=Catenulispora pinisilvae TaxID=2705253 RepID=UPI002B279600|nr:MFS transporter [Catenulispora pinisilvae]
MPESANSRRYLILAICCMSLFIVGIDNTAVNVALPSIQRDLKAPVSGLQWTIDAYTLTLASGLILAGSLGDRFGRRKVFMSGTSLFVVGSALCALAPNLGALVGARALQGVGGAMMNPVAMSIITNVFTDAKDRAKAIGLWSAAFGVSMALGPVVGGLLLSAFSWRSIFWVNVPVGVAAVVLTRAFVPESKAPTARRFDPVGQWLGIVFLAGITYAIIEAPRAGWLSAQTVVVFLVAIAAAAGFVAYELRREQPLIDPRFFGSLPFSGATLMAVSGFLALGGFLFMNTLYLQDALGYSALKAGLLTLPIAVASIIAGPRSGRWVANHGPRVPLIAAGLLLALSALMLTGLTATTPLALLLASYAVLGLGFGVLNPPITNTAVSGMPRTQAGVAAAVASTSRQVGQTLGVAIIGSVVVARATGPARTGLPAASHAGWWLLFGCGLTVFVLGMLTTGKRAAATAERTAARLTEPAEPTTDNGIPALR